MFLRESEGIYRFGSSQVHIKIEKGQIIVKVGGGFLHVEDFIKMYTPLEVRTVKRKADVVQKF